MAFNWTNFPSNLNSTSSCDVTDLQKIGLKIG